jgi:hypothetical protein
MSALSFEGRIDAALQRTGLTADQLSAMSRIRGRLVSTSKISSALSGIRPFSNEDGLFLLDILADLEALIAASQPLPLSTRNPAILCDLIQQIKDTPPDLPALQDLLLMSSVFGGRSLAVIASNLQISRADLQEKISEIGIKLARASLHLSQIIEEIDVDA